MAAPVSRGSVFAEASCPAGATACVSTAEAFACPVGWSGGFGMWSVDIRIPPKDIGHCLLLTAIPDDMQSAVPLVCRELPEADTWRLGGTHERTQERQLTSQHLQLSHNTLLAAGYLK